MQASLSKKEYIEQYAPDNLKKNIQAQVIGGYFCGVLSLAVAIFVSRSVFTSIEALAVIALSMGIQFYKSNICAVMLFIIGIAEYAMKCYYTHSYTPNLIFLVGAYATFNLFNATKLYKSYLKENHLS